MAAETAEREKAVRILVQCMECGKRWRTSNLLPQCPKCNGVDIEPAEL